MFMELKIQKQQKKIAQLDQDIKGAQNVMSSLNDEEGKADGHCYVNILQLRRIDYVRKLEFLRAERFADERLNRSYTII